MISAFEHVTVLKSIILGLGITQILTSIADLIHRSKRVKVYWHMCCGFLLCLSVHVQKGGSFTNLKPTPPGVCQRFY
jgi:hypothetical protein